MKVRPVLLAVIGAIFLVFAFIVYGATSSMASSQNSARANVDEMLGREPSGVESSASPVLPIFLGVLGAGILGLAAFQANAERQTQLAAAAVQPVPAQASDESAELRREIQELRQQIQTQTEEVATAEPAAGATQPAEVVELPDATPALPPAGWYPDPAGDSDLRWWDGTAWSKTTKRSM